MKRIAMPLVLMGLMACFAGCGEGEIDCKKPLDRQSQQKCAHEAMTENSIGRTPNPKKW